MYIFYNFCKKKIMFPSGVLHICNNEQLVTLSESILLVLWAFYGSSSIAFSPGIPERYAPLAI
ncbi:MAG: hypothetical protein FWC47_04160, partial [Oscillospiraceae bacterium]|nr:hypothetical protein [Oscillospiraceae bacterium]